MVENNYFLDSAIKCIGVFSTTMYDTTRVNLLIYRLYMDEVRLIDKYSPLRITLEEKNDDSCTDYNYEFNSNGLLRVGLKTSYDSITKIPNLPKLHYSLDKLVLYGDNIKSMLSEQKIPELLISNPLVLALKTNTLKDNLGLYVSKQIIDFDRFCE